MSSGFILDVSFLYPENVYQSLYQILYYRALFTNRRFPGTGIFDTRMIETGRKCSKTVESARKWTQMIEIIGKHTFMFALLKYHTSEVFLPSLQQWNISSFPHLYHWTHFSSSRAPPILWVTTFWSASQRILWIFRGYAMIQIKP